MRASADPNPSMKLATYKDGSRDGQLVVVSRDLSSAHYAAGIATRLQQVLDDWNFLSPQLQDLSETLNGGKARHAFPFEPRQCAAPLPRAFQWVQATTPLEAEGTIELRPGCADPTFGPRDDASIPGGSGGLRVGAALAVVTGDIAAGALPGPALDGVRLLMLALDWQRAAPDEAAPLQPPPAFGPVAVTPDELGDAWRGGRAHATLAWQRHGRPAQRVEVAAAQRWHFGELIAAVAGQRPLRSGALVGSGMLGEAFTLQAGDAVKLALLDADGHPVLGSLEQTVTARARD